MIKTVDVKESFEKKNIQHPFMIKKKKKTTQQTWHREDFFNMQF